MTGAVEPERGPPGEGRPDGAPARAHASWLDRGLAAVAGLVLRLLAATWRLEVRGVDPVGVSGRRAEVGAIWHRDVLLAAAFFRDRGFAVGVSRSRDGDRIAALLAVLGFAPPPRGSSSRGAVPALLGLVRLVRHGTTVAIITDGPRGPALEPKPGVVALARLTDVPVTPVAFAASPRIRFGSWDRTVLPLPFARVRVHFGDPIAVPRATPTEALPGFRDALERAHRALTESLEAELGGSA